ncbi:MAG: RDD family protein [Planctomycetes bacterium]|nr:RDD family protein [Planctomycetota bacterium]
MTTFEPTESVLTPEGFELRFGRATASERLVALAIDLGIVLLATFALVLLLWFTLGIGAAMLVAFLLRHGYFTWFEARWNGRTPGKRLFHLRVVRADGGPLTVETVLARNLTREVELFLPLTVLLQPDALFPDQVGWVRLVAVAWILGLFLFPLSNPHRLRIGDLLAGTRVVVTPPVALVHDLADVRRAGQEPRDGVFAFSAAQLSIYGEHELSVLEDVLRKAKRNATDPALVEVAKSIGRRIGFDDAAAVVGHEARFLREFYAAQRRHLEQQLLLGRRRLKKVPRTTKGARPS